MSTKEAADVLAAYFASPEHKANEVKRAMNAKAIAIKNAGSYSPDFRDRGESFAKGNK